MTVADWYGRGGCTNRQQLHVATPLLLPCSLCCCVHLVSMLLLCSAAAIVDAGDRKLRKAFFPLTSWLASYLRPLIPDAMVRPQHVRTATCSTVAGADTHDRCSSLSPAVIACAGQAHHGARQAVSCCCWLSMVLPRLSEHFIFVTVLFCRFGPKVECECEVETRQAAIKWALTVMLHAACSHADNRNSRQKGQNDKDAKGRRRWRRREQQRATSRRHRHETGSYVMRRSSIALSSLRSSPPLMRCCASAALFCMAS